MAKHNVRQKNSLFLTIKARLLRLLAGIIVPSVQYFCFQQFIKLTKKVISRVSRAPYILNISQNISVFKQKEVTLGAHLQDPKFFFCRIRTNYQNLSFLFSITKQGEFFLQHMSQLPPLVAVIMFTLCYCLFFLVGYWKYSC